APPAVQRHNEDRMASHQIGFAPVNGLRLYYEIHGAARLDQPPLVLLHGGGDTIETSFGHVLPALARTRQIIALEQQGYGHTADVDRPFSFEQSADDTAALLAYLRIERADAWRRYEKPDCEGLAPSRCTTHRHGSSPLRPGGDHPLLARVGIPGDLHGRVGPHDARSPEKGP